MTVLIIITLCCLLLLAYIFDVSASKTKIPSVILLLILGWAVKQVADFVKLPIPDLNGVLPILGTIGLILIVLEGSLELELNRSKLGFVAKSSIIAFVPILIMSFGLGYAFMHFGATTFKIGLSNAIPFAIISSAIAIPSVQNLSKHNKEFVTYESSLSDIFGVIFFNFITLNAVISAATFGEFFLELLLIFVVTIIATFCLAYLLGKIKHHVKFIPIVLLIILIYEISKIFHLPALVFILFFGLFLGNLDQLKKYTIFEKVNLDILKTEVHKFSELTIEITFLVRALFFLLFGFLLDTVVLLNQQTVIWTGSIVVGILIIRVLFLKAFKFPIMPLVFIAPRGLITILLFLSIPATLQLDLANKSLVIQVIVLSAIVMMIGMMFHTKKDPVESVVIVEDFPEPEEEVFTKEK